MTTQTVSAEQLEEEFAISQESIAAIADSAGRGQGFSIPTEGGTVNVKPDGRPASFLVFAWDGTPSQVPIAYDAGGLNPKIDRYLRKRHCNNCGRNGFITQKCTNCRSDDTIRMYYLRQSDVPFKIAVNGDIPCVCSQEGPVVSNPPCVRHGTNGFLDRNQMMMHALSKHPREYGIWRDMQRVDAGGAGSASADIARLERMIEQLQAQLAEKAAPVEAEKPYSEACPDCGKVISGKTQHTVDNAMRMHRRTHDSGEGGS